MSHDDYLKQALELAKKAEQHDDIPIGAVVVKDGKVVGQGYNTREHLKNPVGHAEINALQDAAKNLGYWNLEGCEVWSTLEPCVMCMGAMVLSRIKKVYYGAYDLKGGAVSLKLNLHDHSLLNHKIEVEYFECKECSEMIKNFFKNIRGKTREKI